MESISSIHKSRFSEGRGTFIYEKTPRTTVGLAYVARICNDPLYSYSLNSALGGGVWIVVAHELGHNLSARHADDETGCGETIMFSNAPTTATQFCSFSINQITSYVYNNGSCLHFESNPPSQADYDFDADGESDISLFRPSDTHWYIERSSEGYLAGSFGLATDKLAPADYDGDGETDVAVFRDGTFYALRSTAGFLGVNLGAAGDIPAPGDFNGDGKDEPNVFRPSTGVWYTLDLTTNQTSFMQFGQSGDKPAVRNYDGDLRDDYAVYRPSEGKWYLQQSLYGFWTVQFGLSTDIPVPADYDGDSRDDIAVFRPSTGMWYLQRSALGGISFAYGQAGDIPTPADYDGDGRADVSIYRNGLWIRNISSTGADVYINFGLPGDVAVPSYDTVQ